MDHPHGDEEARIRPRRRRGVHRQLRGAGVPVRPRARAGRASRRNLVVLYLSGGNDALSTLIPYTDHAVPTRAARRSAIPAGNVLQIGSDSAGNALGLHPRLTGLRTIFNAGRLALIQRTGYANSSRSHFQGTDIWSTADPRSPQGTGWLGRYLDTLPSPVDPLTGWSTVRETPRTLLRADGRRAVDPERRRATRSPARTPAPTRRLARQTRDAHRVARAGRSAAPRVRERDGAGGVRDARPRRRRSATYRADGDVSEQRLRAGAAGGRRRDGAAASARRCSGCRPAATTRTPARTPTRPTARTRTLMATLNDGLFAFYNDLRNQGLLGDTLVLQFSEFGRRISENGSNGTDHGAASVMMAMGGGVRGGIYGTAPNLRIANDNPTLENSGQDVRYETDFRSVYAQDHRHLAGRRLGGDPRRGLPGQARRDSL